MTRDNQEPRREVRIGFAVNGGRMSSLGPSGATFVGNNNSFDVNSYRSTSGIGQSHVRSTR